MPSAETASTQEDCKAGLDAGAIRAAYRDFFQGRLADIQHARRQAMWMGAVWTLAGVFAGASFGYAALGGFGSVGETAGKFLMAGALLSAGGCIVLGLRPLKKVHRRIKELVVGGICERLGLDYTLEAGGFPRHLFKEKDLVPNHDRSNYEDRITGRWNGVSMDAVDAHLEKRVRRGKSTSYETVFRGLLVVCDFAKRFEGTTVVTRDMTAIGNFFGRLSRDGERVRLESPDFEKVFEVYSNDQVEARYLLTPGFMERLLKLRAMLHETPTLGFFDQRLFMVLPMKDDSFEAGGLFGDFADPDVGVEMFRELQLLIEIVETIRRPIGQSPVREAEAPPPS